MIALSPEVFALVGAAGGTVAGWMISGMTVVPRVAAIEVTLARIEARLDAMARGGCADAA